MKIFSWNNIRLLLILGIALFLYAFSSHRNSTRNIAKIEVNFDGEDALLMKPEAVNKLLIEKNGGSKSVAKEKLDLNKLEKSVNAHEMVEKSQIFVSVDGVLKAVVKQKTPVARVFDQSSSFYLDNQGSPMPLSELHTARVPIVQGEIPKDKAEKVSAVLRKIQDDEFLKKNITGVEIGQKGNLKMSNRNFDYVIEFGMPENIDRKFENYKAFFQKASRDSVIKNYKKVNLKFTQQVVCTK